MANYWGIDISLYPGDSAMQSWKNNSSYVYTGFYLAPTPYHPDTGWMTKRATLMNQVWVFLPIYLGRQADSSNLTAAQGTADAQNAISLANSAGFNNSTFNTYIYLDIEQGGTLSSKYITYITAWVTAINNSAHYWPGIYCSYSSTAQQIYNAISGISSATRYWIYNVNYSGTPGSGSAPNPTGCGVNFATTWQLKQNISQTHGGTTLTIDANSSIYQDPSQ